MTKRQLEVRRLGRIGYIEALRLQKELERDVIEHRERGWLLLLEHPHTFTVGRRSKETGVLATAEILKSIGAEVHETDRGGKVTYHGLGQIVGLGQGLDGRAEVVPSTRLTVSGDHRASDGHAGSLLLTAIANALQHPDDL